MRSLFIRIFTLFSFVVLLLVANIAIRFYEWSHSSTTVNLTIPKISLLDMAVEPRIDEPSVSGIESQYAQQIFVVPDYRTKIAQRTKSLPKIEFKKIDKKIDIFNEAWGEVELDDGQLEKWKEIRGEISIPSQENFEPQKIDSLNLPETKLIALFEGFKFQDKVLVAQAPKDEPVRITNDTPAFSSPEKSQIIKDEVKTITAKSIEQDPEFFEYQPESENVLKVKAVEPQSELLSDKKSEIYDYSNSAPQIAKVEDAKVALESIEFFNLIKETTMPVKKSNIPKNEKKKPALAMATQPIKNEPKNESNAFVASHHNSMTVVHGLSVSSQVKDLRHYDLRAVDDGQTIIQDNGTSEVVLKENLQSENNSRSFLLLNREHVVTHVDVPFAPGRADITVPALEKEYAEKFQIRNQKAPRGMVMVELDEKTENITLDGAKYSTVFFDEKFKESKIEDAAYVMFFGVEVGNRTLFTTDSRGKTSPRIIHVFEEELTFDPNLYLEQKDLVVTLKEEDLMSQKPRELGIAASDINLTLSNIKAERLGTNTYKLKAPALLMGSRHYLTLSHQREEIFVGVDTSKVVHIPSEDLISAVIRKFKLQGHASACLIQVNLDRPAKKYEVMAESHQETHVSYALVLDKDGGFYESMGEDSKKLFIMSESQAGEAFTQNAKINIKIDFLDGSTKSFSSFCSPNTYLVEQL